uniref:Zinc finger, CCHC-type n=1 Tax=Tanacetum cinerariifolium TaxID=118510 RepID=A0A699HAN9_TANCI|nr:zinc finger, CCHC-type [Tanacetum cinerariifolium]
MAGNMVKEMTTNFRKLDKFEGHDFRRWHKKMQFMLTTLKVVYVLTTPMPELLEDAIVDTNKYSVYMSSSTVINFSLWHARLGHVHYKRMLEISKDDLIPAIAENPGKCTTCMLTKITRKPFQRIIHETTTLYTSQQNGVAERKNRALKEMVNSMLSYSGLSEGAVVRLPDAKHKILGKKGIDCIFVGYAAHSKAYRDDHSDDVPNEIPKPRKGKRVQKGCKWIFKRKMKFDGTVDKFKARLVIQGFRQKKGIDYFETYAPVARITTIRLLLSLAVIHNLVIHQMDVKIAFLNGDLEEEVYMKQPEGFVIRGNEHEASKKLTCITGSTMESEFVALAAAGKEAEWLRNLIHEIPIWPKPIAPISIRCDIALIMDGHIVRYMMGSLDT